MKQRFFKLDSRWYADVPGHTLAENEMVCGADSLLEEMAAMAEELASSAENLVETLKFFKIDGADEVAAPVKSSRPKMKAKSDSAPFVKEIEHKPSSIPSLSSITDDDFEEF